MRRIVISSLVIFVDNVANGDVGPSSSANSCIFHVESFVMADSALCKIAESVKRPPHIASPCSGEMLVVAGASLRTPTDARTRAGRYETSDNINDRKHKGTILRRGLGLVLKGCTTSRLLLGEKIERNLLIRSLEAPFPLLIN